MPLDRPWTATCVAVLNVLSVAGAPVNHIAYTLRRTEADVTGALWALPGRSLDEAVVVLNRPPESLAWAAE